MCAGTHVHVHACNDLTTCKMSSMQHAHMDVGYMSGIGHLL